MNCMPFITRDEWGKLIARGHITGDWAQWNEREAIDQWKILGNAGFITKRPAPGVAEEGSDDGSLPREEYPVCNSKSRPLLSPEMPPSAEARPQAPYRTVSLASGPAKQRNDSASGSNGGAASKGIPSRPEGPKPSPPRAPWGDSTGKGKGVKEKEKGVLEVNTRVELRESTIGILLAQSIEDTVCIRDIRQKAWRSSKEENKSSESACMRQ